MKKISIKSFKFVVLNSSQFYPAFRPSLSNLRQLLFDFLNNSHVYLFSYRLEEVTAQANKFSRLIEQREEQVRGLKTRLEEAVHQNNKMTHAAELRDDKIKTLQQRLV